MENEHLFTRNYIYALLSGFILFFTFYLLIPIFPFYLIDTYNASFEQIGIILACYSATAIIIRPFCNFLVNYFDRKTLLIGSFAIFALLFIGYGICDSLALFIVLRIVHGLSFGLVATVSSTVGLDIIPSRHRNEGSGYYSYVSNVSLALGPMISLFIYETTRNYDLIFTIAFLCSIVGVIVASLIKTKKRQRMVHAPLSMDRFFMPKAMFPALLLVLISISMGLTSTYVALYGVKELGINYGSGYFFILLVIGSILAQTLFVTRISRDQMLRRIVVGCLILIAGYSFFIAVRNPLSFFASALLIGIGFGMTRPLIHTIMTKIANHNERGTANSTFMLSCDCGVGIGVFIGGFFAQFGGFVLSFEIGIVMLVLATLLIVGKYLYLNPHVFLPKYKH